VQEVRGVTVAVLDGELVAEIRVLGGGAGFVSLGERPAECVVGRRDPVDAGRRLLARDVGERALVEAAARLVLRPRERAPAAGERGVAADRALA
jgi:hypothetical protein